VKTSSAKAKGRALQNFVRDHVRRKYVKSCTMCALNNCKGYKDPVHIEGLLQNEDIESRPMGSSGTDIILSPNAKRWIPYDIECKAQESLNLWSAWEQTVANTKSGRTPLLIIKRNRSEVLAVMRFEDVTL
jgi:hypothetical protein